MKTATKRKLTNRHAAVYLACALAAATLVLSGCGKSGSGDTAGNKEEVASAEVALGGTAHTHDNPDEACFICDPSKREKGRLWCKGHARYEDRCWLCHPELEDKSRMFCKEHAVYEDECFLCHPELKPDGESAQRDPSGTSGGEARSTVLFCNEHNVPEIECGICQPDLASSLEPGENLKVRLPSVKSAGKAGIRTQLPGIQVSAPVIKAFCEVRYNLNTMARVTPLAGGVIHEVRHDVGAQVKAGETLVVLHSSEVAASKSDYLTAIVENGILHQTFERETRLKEQKISAESEFLDAEAAYRTGRLVLSNLKQKLINLGMTGDEIIQLEKEQVASADLEIRAPFSGTLVERAAVVGEAIEMGHALFTIADLSTHWLAMSIPSDRIREVRLGQNVEARFSDLPDTTYTGSVTWVDTSVDVRTRMVRARAVITDRTGHLKAGLFGDANILTAAARSVAIVPREAVQRHEGGEFVFVQNEPNLFSLRRVALGETHGEGIAVLVGLTPNDSVVTDGSFIVMSEFLKSRLGAGCVDD